jgi:hypothetical protein
LRIPLKEGIRVKAEGIVGEREADFTDYFNVVHFWGNRLPPGVGIPFSKIPCKFLTSAKCSQNTLEKSEDVFASSNYHTHSLSLCGYLVQIAIWPERRGFVLSTV